jgi:hypothetical protein
VAAFDTALVDAWRVAVTRKLVLWFVLGTFLWQVVGCTYQRPVPVENPASRTKGYDEKHGWRIVGYVTKDGVQHAFNGYALIDKDRIVHFTPLILTRPAESPIENLAGFTLPGDRVAAFVVEDLNELGQTGRVIAISGAVVIGVVIIAYTVLAIMLARSFPDNSQNSSCPFVYSFDGERWILDAEPYGGAIARGLARRDFSRLEHVSAEPGVYRLLLANPTDAETQHTDRLDLLAVDAPPGCRVVLEESGTVHALRATAALIAAHDGYGADIARQLRAADHDIWNADVDAACESLPRADWRDHLTLEFERPNGAQTVYLIGNVATSQWSSPALTDFVHLHGDRLGEFYTAVDRKAAARQALLDWNDREELMRLFVNVHTNGGWERQGSFFGGSPWVGESRAVRLDLRHVEGDRIRLRLDPPTGFWSLNSFELAWDEVPVSSTEIPLATATDAAGNDVRASLVAAEGTCLDFPDRAAHAVLTFAIPPQPAGSERTVFARTDGWYTIHADESKPADVATLQRLQTEPGAIVQRALGRYAELKRSLAEGRP